MPLRLGVLTLVFLSLATNVDASAVAGHDYMVLAVPQRPEGRGKIEVVEFFSWGCPHCYKLYPLLTRWRARLPPDTSLRRIPEGLGHPEWVSLARAYYALESTGDLARLDAAIFEAIHRDHVALFDEPSITAWVGKHGVNVPRFTKAFHDFSADTRMGQSETAAVNYRISGIPTLAVGGRYTVTGEDAATLAIADELIARVRADEQKPKKQR